MSTVAGGSPAGQARAAIKITWNSATSVVISGSVTDVCPADGAGAYLWLRGKTSATTNNAIGPQLLAKDTNGCGNGSLTFSVTVPNGGYKVQTVHLTLEEKDGSGVCDNSGCITKVTSYNPYA
ncbi:MAG: hypothetical protein NTV23_01955 [Propionibacteriales bacterium]|nr:hypothetical protein [Propionibacteriales bacterium]